MKYTSGSRNILIAGILGSISLVNLLNGVIQVSEVLNQRNAVREAVYSKAETITPEVIRNANELSNKVGDSKYQIAAINFAATGFVGLVAYSLARKKE